MSTAILISGQLRTFARCWPTQRWHVLRHFEDPHFFITVQDGPEIQLTDDLSREYGADRVHVDARTDPDLSAHLTPDLGAAYHQAPYTNAAPAHQLLLQHWYQAECWKFFQTRTVEQEQTERTENQKDSTSVSSVTSCSQSADRFDTIIRLRGDLWFHSFENSLERTHHRVENNGTPAGPVRIKRAIYKWECFTPWWGRFGGINDRFAIMGPEAASYYFTVWDHIPELLAAGCPFHPESLVKANLERGNVDLHETLRTEFSTLRPPGDPRGEQRFPEIAPWDIAHAALRSAA
jgi:hypothetical protein